MERKKIKKLNEIAKKKKAEWKKMNRELKSMGKQPMNKIVKTPDSFSITEILKYRHSSTPVKPPTPVKKVHIPPPPKPTLNKDEIKRRTLAAK